MKILLLCNAGMSTGILQMKLQEEAEKRGIDAEILAIPLVELSDNLDQLDVVLLGPQIRFAEDDVRSQLPEAIPLLVVQATDFGTMNAEKIMNQLLNLIA